MQYNAKLRTYLYKPFSFAGFAPDRCNASEVWTPAQGQLETPFLSPWL
jgi:hypothetical protein